MFLAGFPPVLAETGFYFLENLQDLHKFAFVMLQKSHGVVLYVVKYSDRSNIVHVYTEQNGQMSFLVPAVRRSRRSSAGAVLFQPFSLIGFETDVRPSTGLHPIREVEMWYPLVSLPFHPYKAGMAMFLAEFLYRVLQEEGGNEPLFNYVVSSIRWLDACEKDFSNFHLVFLIRLSRFLGFYPNLEHYVSGAFFDMLNACFVAARPSHGQFLSAEESSRILKLMRMNYDTMHLFAMNRTERNRCLEVIVGYYRLHLPAFPELKSLSVLRELFI